MPARRLHDLGRPGRHSTFGALLAVAAFACERPPGTTSLPAEPPSAAPGGEPPRLAEPAAPWRYRVTAADRATRLSVHAQFERAPSERFGVDRFADPFVFDVSVRAAGAERRVEVEDGAWRVPECRNACELRYDYALGDAADHIDNLRFAARHGDTLIAPPSTFLLHPAHSAPGIDYAFDVTTEPGWSFVSGVFKTGNDVYAADSSYLPRAPYSGFGRFRVHQRRALDAELEVAIAPGDLEVAEADVLAWIDRSANLVGSYLGRFPIERALILVLPRRGKRLFGMQMGGGGGAIYYDVGRHVTRDDLADDWIGPHEMLHLAQPTLARQHLWFQEGFATYVEPVIRARAGELSAERVWREFYRAMRQGQPKPGDRGLDATPTWGRIYWGGAAFWLLSDIEIRKRTGGRRSLRDAAVAVVESGGNCAVGWDLEEVIEVADRGAGVPVLSELFQRFAVRSEAFPLAALWQDLGVVEKAGRVVLDDSAKLAELRRAITERGVLMSQRLRLRDPPGGEAGQADPPDRPTLQLPHARRPSTRRRRLACRAGHAIAGQPLPATKDGRGRPVARSRNAQQLVGPSRLEPTIVVPRGAGKR